MTQISDSDHGLKSVTRISDSDHGLQSVTRISDSDRRDYLAEGAADVDADR